MKKTLSLILAIFICLTALYACETDTPDTSGSDESIEAQSTAISYDEVSYFIPGGDESATEESQTENSEPNDTPSESSADDSKPEESSKPSETSKPTETSKPVQLTGRFELKMAKYDYNNTIEKQNTWYGGTDYGDVSIALLDITNGTDKNYSVTIHGKYLGKDGNVLKTETQTWDQFASGLQKYFLFRPNMLFDKFEYTIEATEYNGECWKNGFTMEFTKLVKLDRTVHPAYGTVDPKWVEAIGAEMITTIDTQFPITHGPIYFLLFDANKNVIGVYGVGREEIGWGPLEPFVKAQTHVYYANSEDGKLGKWPEIFEGDVTGITIITTVGKGQQ